MANGFGLYDMAGNADELCWDSGALTDPYDRTNPKGTIKSHKRAARGGSFLHPASRLRLPLFGLIKQYQAYRNIGFRVVRCDAGVHPADGNERGDVVLLDIPEGAEAEPLQGATFRANTQRTGEFKASGVPELKGLKWRFKTGDKVRSSPVVVGGVLYVGSLDGNFYALDIESGYMRWVFKSGGSINSVPYADEEKVYFGSNDGRAYALWRKDGTEAWSYDTGTTVQSTVIGYHDYIIFISDGGAVYFFSPDGTLLASGRQDWRVKIWRVGSWQEVAVLEGHHGGVLGIAFSPDGRLLVSGSADNTIKLWDLSSLLPSP